MSVFDSAPIFFDQKRFSSDLTSQDPVRVFKNALNAADNHFNNRFNEGDEAHRLVRERAAFVDLMLLQVGSSSLDYVLVETRQHAAELLVSLGTLVRNPQIEAAG